jgi:hypothetical protein
MTKIKLFLLVLFMASISISSFADGKKGIRAGYQMSNFYYNGSGMNDAYGSFYIGIFKEHKIVPMIHIGSGLEYSQLGSYTDNDNKVQMHYLSIPINVKAKLGPFYATLGASASFKVGEKWTIKGIEADPLEKANSFDVPVFVGAGFQFLMFRVEARYHWGTMSLYDNTLNPYKTQNLQLGLALAI